MPASRTACPGCGGTDLTPVHAAAGVPVQSMLLLRDPAAARSVPAGDLDLALCGACGLIFNRTYDPALTAHEGEYEASQGFSATFSAFQQRLAEDLIGRHRLHGKRIVEIGCGQGEFLRRLCDLGGNSGVGFDPCCVDAHGAVGDDGRVRVVREPYDPAHPDAAGDLICCIQTLEHIADPYAFVARVRAAVGARRDVPVVFQVPDVAAILRDGAFWDVYYEHCTYFTAGALRRLFRRAGFDVLGCRSEYDGQYLLIEALAGDGDAAEAEADGDDTGVSVEAFAASCRQQIAAWRGVLDQARRDGERLAIWGGGSKTVAFLTTLGAGDEVAYAIDINPRKQGCYLPGTGHAVAAPSRLVDEPVDRVIAMNPIYLSEIWAEMDRLGVAPELWPATRFTAQHVPPVRATA